VASLLRASAGYLALALIFTYPLILAPHKANRFDSPDAQLSAWILSWVLEQFTNGRLDVFDANIFFPEKNTLAYSENLITAAVLVFPLRWLSDNPILLLNAAFIVALALNGTAAFLLARQFWGSSPGAVMTGLIFAFASFHWAHLPHPQLQLCFPLAAAFYFSRRIRQGSGAAASLGLALSVAASFGASGYYAVYLSTVLPLFILFDVPMGAPEMRRKATFGVGLAAVLAFVMCLPLVMPYVSKMNLGYRRQLSVAADFSADGLSYLTSLSRLHFFLPDRGEPLFAGFVASGLAVFGLVRSFTRREKRHDVALWIGVGLLGVLISMGPSLGLFSALYRVLPGYQGLRVPSRAGILFLLAVAMLAGLGYSYLRNRRLGALLLVLAAAECYAGPLYWSMEAPVLPPIYRSLARLDEPGALVELPLPPPEHFQQNAGYVYRSIFHWRPLVNGYSGFVPESYERAHESLMKGDFLDGLVVWRSKGVRLLLAHRARLGPRMRKQIAQAESIGLLELIDERGPDVLYRIVEIGPP